MGLCKMPTARLVISAVTSCSVIGFHPAGTGGLSARFGVRVQHSISADARQGRTWPCSREAQRKPKRPHTFRIAVDRRRESPQLAEQLPEPAPAHAVTLGRREPDLTSDSLDVS